MEASPPAKGASPRFACQASARQGMAPGGGWGPVAFRRGACALCARESSGSVPRMRVPRVARRSVNCFESDPSSIRNAVTVMVVATVFVVAVSSIGVWILDLKDFPDFGTAIWFVLQTVTTVGYGDVTPTSVLGRVVASFVMVFSISLIAIVTALVTSTFVEAAQQRRRRDELESQLAANREILDRLDKVADRLTSLEEGVAGVASGQPGKPPR